MLTAIQAVPLIEALVVQGIGAAEQIAAAWRAKGLLSDEAMNVTLEAIAANADARAALAAKDEAGN